MVGFVEFLGFCRGLNVCKEIVRCFCNSCFFKDVFAIWVRVKLMPPNLDIQPVCYLDPVLDSSFVLARVQKNALCVG